MVIVSDSTTLIILYDLQKLEYLENLFKKIFIPKAVYDEISYKKALKSPLFIKLSRQVLIESFMNCFVTFESKSKIIMNQMFLLTINH